MSGSARLTAVRRPDAARPLAVAGAGSIGRRHLENLGHLGIRDLVVLEPGSSPGRSLRAVLVCNPTALHVPTALAAAREGAHLFLEKPLSHDLRGVADLEAEVQERGLVALVGFQYRFHPGLRKIREWLHAGALGTVVSVRAAWGEHLPSWHPGEDYRKSYSARRELGGGAILTLSHPFDYLRWLLGEVAAVSAEAARRSGLEIDVEDAALVLLRFSSGALGTVSLDYVQRPRRHELEIVGTEATARWIESTGIAALLGPEGDPLAVCPVPSGFTRNAMFVDEMRHFLACLAGEEQPLCSLSDGIAALRIAMAAGIAAREGRAVAPTEVS